MVHSLWLCFAVVEANDSEEEEEELGGLFRVSRPQKHKKVQANALDCSRFNPDSCHNWELQEVNFPLTSAVLRPPTLLQFKIQPCFNKLFSASDAGLHQGLFCYREMGGRPGCSHAAKTGR